MKTKVFLLGIFFMICGNFVYSQELATVEVRNYKKMLSDLSYTTEYPQVAVDNLDEGNVSVRFKISKDFKLEKMQLIGNATKELKEATKKSVENYISRKGSSLSTEVIYEIPVKFILE